MSLVSLTLTMFYACIFKYYAVTEHVPKSFNQNVCS